MQLHVEVQRMTSSPQIFATLVLSCAMLKTLVLDLSTVIVPCLDFVADTPRRSDLVQLRQPHEVAATFRLFGRQEHSPSWLPSKYSLGCQEHLFSLGCQDNLRP